MPGLESEGRLLGSSSATASGKGYAPDPQESKGGQRDFSEPAKLLPIAFVSCTIAGLWFIYVFYHCVPLLQLDVAAADFDARTAQRGFWELVIFHYFTGMLLICYTQSIYVLPGNIPADDPQWMNVGPDGRPLPAAAPLTLQETKKDGHRRFCKWCSKYKPDRCHHCRVCKTCILKMDHHCPWIYNCVGFANYKYFFLLLLHATAACCMIVVTMFESVLWVVEVDEDFSYIFFVLFGETLAFFMLVLLTMFLTFHICLMLWAMTTIEFCEKKLPKSGSGEIRNFDSSVYDLGWYGNIAAVLGPNPLFWLLPICLPKGDGLNFVSDESRLTKDIESGRGTRRKTHQRTQRPNRRNSSDSRPGSYSGGSYPGGAYSGGSYGSDPYPPPPASARSVTRPLP